MYPFMNEPLQHTVLREKTLKETEDQRGKAEHAGTELQHHTCRK